MVTKSEIICSTFKMREWRDEDLESLVKHADNRKIWINLRDAFPHPYTYTDGRNWIKLSKTLPPNINFAIDVNNNAVGAIGIRQQEDVFKYSFEIGYWLGEEFWGKGIMTEALKTYTKLLFDKFTVYRVYAGVYEWNLASAKVLEKAGYSFEARMKRSVFKDGKVIDELIYSITR